MEYDTLIENYDKLCNVLIDIDNLMPAVHKSINFPNILYR